MRRTSLARARTPRPSPLAPVGQLALRHLRGLWDHGTCSRREARSAMDTSPPIGERIYELRAQRRPRMTQRELADRAGVSVDLVAKLEQGAKRSASLDSLGRIAGALEVDVAELLTRQPQVDAKPREDLATTVDPG